MPGAKNGERPYLAVPEPVFSGLFFGYFYSIFCHFASPPTQHYTLIIIFIYLNYNPNQHYTILCATPLHFYLSIQTIT